MAERDDVPPEFQLGEAPIDPKLENMMGVLAHAIDDLFNGSGKGKRNGFILMVFPFSEVGEDGGRANYISNARREDVVKMLRAQIRRFEGEMRTPGHA